MYKYELLPFKLAEEQSINLNKKKDKKLPNLFLQNLRFCKQQM